MQWAFEQAHADARAASPRAIRARARRATHRVPRRSSALAVERAQVAAEADARRRLRAEDVAAGVGAERDPRRDPDVGAHARLDDAAAAVLIVDGLAGAAVAGGGDLHAA